MKKIIQKHFFWTGIRVVLLAALGLFCLGVWPGYVFHTYFTALKYTSQIIETPRLSDGDVVQQCFCPQFGRLSKIKMALGFDEEEAAGKYLLFEIKDSNGKSLCSREIHFDQIQSSLYFDVDIGGKSLKPYEKYVWTLTMQNGGVSVYRLLPNSRGYSFR